MRLCRDGVAVTGLRRRCILTPFAVEDKVMLRAESRWQKLQPAYRRGWRMQSVISPSTVTIEHVLHGQGKAKIVNIDLLKQSPEIAAEEGCVAEENAVQAAIEDSDDTMGFLSSSEEEADGPADIAVPDIVGGYALHEVYRL